MSVLPLGPTYYPQGTAHFTEDVSVLPFTLTVPWEDPPTVAGVPPLLTSQPSLLALPTPPHKSQPFYWRFSSFPPPREPALPLAPPSLEPAKCGWPLVRDWAPVLVPSSKGLGTRTGNSPHWGRYPMPVGSSK